MAQPIWPALKLQAQRSLCMNFIAWSKKKVKKKTPNFLKEINAMELDSSIPLFKGKRSSWTSHQEMTPLNKEKLPDLFHCSHLKLELLASLETKVIPNLSCSLYFPSFHGLKPHYYPSNCKNRSRKIFIHFPCHFSYFFCFASLFSATDAVVP